ncbi:MAG: NAD(P)/FAD-dependent oxidoreductase [Beijerinckiaceae bacterium]
MHVIVVGAGVLGAAAAYYLAVAGHQVSLLEQGDGPGVGVTAKGFGWINLIHSNPDDEANFRLRVDAIEEFQRLRRMLPEAFAGARGGALVWKSTEIATVNLANALLAAGIALEIVDRAEFVRLEPNLLDYPPVAIHAADDLAVDPVFLTAELVKAAVSRGAKLFCDASVQRLRVSSARVVGVDTDSGFIAADSVVLAAGAQTDELLVPLGISLGVKISPALLLKYKAPSVRISRILEGPRLEVRPSSNGTLTAAEGWPTDGDADQVARQVLLAIEDLFGAAGNVEWLSTLVGQRPTFDDGMPRYGAVAGFQGCHVAVGHPGIILAPLLGRKIAEGIAA